MSLVSSANQYTPDERQQKCWDLYIDSIRKGIPNARKAALQAGYSEALADNVTAQGWFVERTEKLKDKGLLSKAERNLDEFLDMDTVEPLIQNGTLVIDEAGNLIKRNNPQLVKEKKETTFFVAERLGKKKYAERHENVSFEAKTIIIQKASETDEPNKNTTPAQADPSMELLGVEGDN